MRWGWRPATGDLADDRVAEAVVSAMSRLVDDIGVTWTLRQFDIPDGDLPAIAVEAQAHSDMASNPRQPTVPEVDALLHEVW